MNQPDENRWQGPPPPYQHSPQPPHPQQPPYSQQPPHGQQPPYSQQPPGHPGYPQTGYQQPAYPTGHQQPRPRGRRPLLIAIAAAVVLVVIVAGTIGVVVFRDHQRQAAFQQAQALQASAEKSYQAGDCDAALRDVQELSGIRPDDVDTDKATALAGFKTTVEGLNGVCTTAVGLAKSSSAPADQVSANVKFKATKGLPTALATAADERISAVIAEHGVTSIVNTGNCANPKQFSKQVAQPSDLGELMFACAGAQEKAQNFKGAQDNYNGVLTDFPESPRVGDAEAGLARSIIGYVKTQQTDDLTVPLVSSSNLSSKATLIIYNNSTHPLRLAFSGPDSIVKPLPVCSQCAGRSDDDLCRGDGPSVTLQVPAGTYETALQATDSSTVPPGLGSWNLAAGQTYLACYVTVGGSSGGSDSGGTGDA